VPSLSHPKSKTSKKLLDNTDSGSVADSESIAAAKSQAQRATVTDRKTASHNIASKTGNLISKKNKNLKGPKGKQKDTAPEPELLEDSDDDSKEREAALSSPIKGKTSRALNKVSSSSLILVLITVKQVISDRSPGSPDIQAH
jgi:hypothetical protein